MEYRTTMIGFFIKKAFFDGWDHLYALAGFNGIALLVALIFFVLPGTLGAPLWFIVAAAVLAVLALSVWNVAVSASMYGVAEGKPAHFRDLWGALPRSLKPGLLLGGIGLLYGIAITVALPFYLAQKAMWGVFVGGLLFWTMLMGLLILQYVPAILARDVCTARAALKTAFYLFVDNPGFSIFLLLWRGFTLAVSAATMFLAPGLTGAALASAVAVRLRMKKYGYLKAHPDVDRRRVPWDELLEEERERVGKRTLKGMIFPWKD